MNFEHFQTLFRKISYYNHFLPPFQPCFTLWLPFYLLLGGREPFPCIGLIHILAVLISPRPHRFSALTVYLKTVYFTGIFTESLPVFGIFNQVFNQERSVIWTWKRDHNRFNTRILVDCVIFNAVSRYFTITMLWFTPVYL